MTGGKTITPTTAQALLGTLVAQPIESDGREHPLSATQRRGI